jgi:hypothetical protein
MLTLGDMSAISPYKIMNYQPKIQDDFNSFFKKNAVSFWGYA